MVIHPDGYPRFIPIGERALLVEFDRVITAAVNQMVHALAARMAQAPLAGVTEWIPAYSSLVALYEPQEVPLKSVENWIRGCLASLPGRRTQSVKQVEILVRYGGADGPDLADVAAMHGLSQAEVVEKHSSPVYRVGMMGFMPGFAYLLGLDPALASPRLKTPRTQVPAGTVGIAGEQTGVYPQASPGGWRLIGRTDQVLFSPEQAPYFTLSPGDAVRFIPTADGVLP
jgi:KipI family sensor histidine kinase inhibitor